MNPRIKFEKKAVGEKNFLDAIAKTKRQVDSMQTSEGFDSSVQESEQNIFMDTNETIVTNGTFIATNTGVTEPTSSSFSGSFMSSSGKQFGDILAYIGSVYNGALQAAFVSSGGVYALGGNMVIDATGLNIYGLNLAQYFEATNDGTTRRVFLGLYLPQNATVPAFSILYTDPPGTNLLTNGDAETGDKTGWTDAQSAFEVNTDSYEGTYAFKHLGSAEAYPGHLLQNVSVTAGDILTFEIAQKRTAGILAPKVKLTWKTSAPATISTDTINLTNSSSYATFSQSFVAPATATNVDIELIPGDPFNDELFDDIQIYVQNVSTEFRLSDGALTAIVDGEEYDLLQRSVGFTPAVFPIGFSGTLSLGTLTAQTLAANGGAGAYPVVLGARMYLESVSISNLNTGTQRSWNWNLYKDVGENTLIRVAVGAAAETFTPAGSRSIRNITAANAPVLLDVGVYWLVIQNVHASNSFDLGTEASAVLVGGNIAQTKTLTNPVGDTLDFVAATWAKNDNPASARLNGRVFGDSGAF